VSPHFQRCVARAVSFHRPCANVRSLGIALALALALTPFQAQAQLFSDDAARRQASQNSEELETIKTLLRELRGDSESFSASINSLRAQNAALIQTNQTLQTRLREMVGRLEEMERQVQEAGSAGAAEVRAAAVRQGLRVEELERRLEAAEGEIANLRQEIKDQGNVLNEFSAFVTIPAEEEMYAAATDNFLAGEMQAAIDGFERILKLHPNGQFGANCRYYLGQAHLKLGNFDAARDQAQTLLNDYPNAAQTPDALLLVAMAYEGMGLAEQYEAQLRYLISEHPTSLAADQARQRITRR